MITSRGKEKVLDKGMQDIPYLAEAFGLALRQARQHAGMTQEELARRIGAATSYIGFLEHGQRVPTIKTFHHVCFALSLDPHEFLASYLQMQKSMFYEQSFDEDDEPVG